MAAILQCEQVKKKTTFVLFNTSYLKIKTAKTYKTAMGHVIMAYVF